MDAEPSVSRGPSSETAGASARRWYVQERGPRRVVVLAVLTLLVPVGFGAIAVTIWLLSADFVRQHQSADWPTTEGRVTFSAVSRISQPAQNPDYRADVGYAYQVDRRSLLGSRVRLVDTGVRSEAAQRAIVDRYPVGATVRVHYDPADPRTTVLEAGLGSSDVSRGLLALGLAMVPVVMLVHVVHRWRWLNALTVGGWHLHQAPVPTLVPMNRVPALVGLGLVTLALVIVPPLTEHVARLPLGATCAITALAVAASVGAWLWLRRSARLGRRHLVVDARNGQLMTPAERGRRYLADFGSVERIEARHCWRRHRGLKFHRYEVWVVLRHEESEPVRIAEFAMKANAAAMRAWILAEMGRDEGEWDEAVTHWHDGLAGRTAVAATASEQRAADAARSRRQAGVVATRA